MKINKPNVKRSILFVLLGILISVVLITAFSWIVSDVSAKMTYEATLSVKKNMLYEYVNNFIIYLDGEIDQYLDAHPDADEAELEEAMLEIARKRIYEEEHFDGAYMWVQKVLDYNGGDDYAIRLIHPNLSDTEGCYLSTNEVNQMGMKAYETELRGIVADGEIYQNYAFKKLESDEVTEKVTYAKLYEPFDWIICMGVNLDDVEHYKFTA
ncbi:MAG: cache domain-containing protein, partial [Lachnospiraceae bacterium]|nr:cache domain-containing protein [Lachnospiraceae bacterium]